MRSCWESGQRVVKCIGFDATEDHRMKGGGTYATGKGFNICNEKGMPKFADRYEVEYPLRLAGITRSRCREIIVAAGLPVPPKSACFFCPAMHKDAIQRLAVVDPEYYKLAIAMEALYRGGHHFRGDDYWTVRARRKDTKELTKFECTAADAKEARTKFRAAFADTQRPFKYKLTATAAVPGLGRRFAWKDVQTSLPIVTL